MKNFKKLNVVEMVAILQNMGGRRWSKYNADRVYFNNAFGKVYYDLGDFKFVGDERVIGDYEQMAEQAAVQYLNYKNVKK